MNDYPLFSVCVRAYNSERFIADAIKSIINQDYCGPIEIIVCYDEGTQDNTLKVLEGIDTPPDRLLTIYKHTHLTPFRALSACCLSTCKGSYVTFLDSDNLLRKDSISNIVKIASNIDASFFFTKVELIDGEGRPLGKVLVEIPNKPYKIKTLLRGNYIDINSIILRNDCLELIKNLLTNETLRAPYFDWLFEDWLIALLALRHCKPYYIDIPYALYRVHDTNLTYGTKRTIHRELFNLERSIKTLIAFYAVERYKLNNDELRTMQETLININVTQPKVLAEHQHELKLIKLYSAFLRLIKKGAKLMNLI